MPGVLLTHCNHLFFDRKQVRKMQPYPPLQTLLAAACLRRDGWATEFFDSTFVSPEGGFLEALREHSPDLLVICEDHFNFLTKMCLVANRDLAFRMGALARAAGVPVIVASSDASDNIIPYLSECADFVVLGEVEQTLSELVGCLLRTGGDIAQVQGIAYRDLATGTLRITARRDPIQNLDSLPLAAWDIVDTEAYRRAWIAAHGEFSLNAISSRGCPFQCNWCAKPVFGSHYRVRSPQSMACEMHFLKNRFHPDHLWFADDIFALSPSWTFEFAGAVEERSCQIPFKMQSRCDLMTRNTVSALRRAGCAEVWMGAESGSQKVLDAMDKGIRVEQILQARENLASHGIRVGLFLQFGYPGETLHDIRQTIAMVRRAQPDAIGVSVSYPLPGTRFYDLVALQLGAKKNWKDSDDLSMMYQGRFSSEFYLSLRDALHAEVDGACEAQIAALWSQVESRIGSNVGSLHAVSEDPAVALWTSC
jgi:anaerobic magnesium-protoporphyrin IX monomethyl ester cyclase